MQCVSKPLTQPRRILPLKSPPITTFLDIFSFLTAEYDDDKRVLRLNLCKIALKCAQQSFSQSKFAQIPFKDVVRSVYMRVILGEMLRNVGRIVVCCLGVIFSFGYDDLASFVSGRIDTSKYWRSWGLCQQTLHGAY